MNVSAAGRALHVINESGGKAFAIGSGPQHERGGTSIAGRHPDTLILELLLMEFWIVDPS